MSSGGSEVLRLEKPLPVPTPLYWDESAKAKKRGNVQAAVKAPQEGRRELSATSKAVKRPRFYLQSLWGTGN